LAKRGVLPDLLTIRQRDDPLNGSAERMTLEAALELRGKILKSIRSVPGGDCATCAGHAGFAEAGRGTFDYGNNIRTFAFHRA